MVLVEEAGSIHHVSGAWRAALAASVLARFALRIRRSTPTRGRARARVAVADSLRALARAATDRPSAPETAIALAYPSDPPSGRSPSASSISAPRPAPPLPRALSPAWRCSSKPRASPTVDPAALDGARRAGDSAPGVAISPWWTARVPAATARGELAVRVATRSRGRAPRDRGRRASSARRPPRSSRPRAARRDAMACSTRRGRRAWTPPARGSVARDRRLMVERPPSGPRWRGSDEAAGVGAARSRHGAARDGRRSCAALLRAEESRRNSAPSPGGGLRRDRGLATTSRALLARSVLAAAESSTR